MCVPMTSAGQNVLHRDQRKLHTFWATAEIYANMFTFTGIESFLTSSLFDNIYFTNINAAHTPIYKFEVDPTILSSGLCD